MPRPTTRSCRQKPAEEEEKAKKVGRTVVGYNVPGGEDGAETTTPAEKEAASRIEKIMETFRSTKILEKCKVLTDFLEIDNAALEKSHSKAMIEELAATETMSQEDIDDVCRKYDSVFLTKNSLKNAKSGVACVRDLAHRIMCNEAPNGFAVTSSGHQAGTEAPCGPCIVNTVSQAAEQAMMGGAKRILVVDLDVHHGQGTQRIYYDDKRVLYFSIHRYEHGLYWPNLPESDFDHIGSGSGLGYTANVPLNETGCGDSDYLSILFHVLLPLATQFDPQFVIVSAGFDSLQGDPLGGMNLTPDTYSHFVYQLKTLAQGRMMLILEGGNDYERSAVAAEKCLRVLLGHAPQRIMLRDPPKQSTVDSCVRLASMLRSRWTCLQYFPSMESDAWMTWPKVEYKSTFKYDAAKRPQIPNNISQGLLPTRKPVKVDKLSADGFETLVYYNEGDETHDHPQQKDHEENPRRTQEIMKVIRAAGILEHCVEKKCNREATDDEILLVHFKEMLQRLKTTETMNDEELMTEADELLRSIYLTKETLHVARKALGTVLQTVDDVYQKPAGIRNAFVIVRPPGHHATASTSSGFCILNNVGVAVEYARKKHGAKRVMIMDWDVHHGNGTQDIFYRDPTVLYVSIHKFEKGFYPDGDGDFFDVGRGAGTGRTVNIPFKKGAKGDVDYQLAMHHVVLPIAYDFNPDLIFVSAGFDAAAGDRIGGYHVTPGAFAEMTHQLSALAAGRIVVVLEGGYHHESKGKPDKPTPAATCALAVCETLRSRGMLKMYRNQKTPFGIKKRKPADSSIETIRSVIQKQQEYWDLLRGFQVIKCPAASSGGSDALLEGNTVAKVIAEGTVESAANNAPSSAPKNALDDDNSARNVVDSHNVELGGNASPSAQNSMLEAPRSDEMDDAVAAVDRMLIDDFSPPSEAGDLDCYMESATTEGQESAAPAASTPTDEAARRGETNETERTKKTDGPTLVEKSIVAQDAELRSASLSVPNARKVFAAGDVDFDMESVADVTEMIDEGGESAAPAAATPPDEAARREDRRVQIDREPATVTEERTNNVSVAQYVNAFRFAQTCGIVSPSAKDILKALESMGLKGDIESATIVIELMATHNSHAAPVRSDGPSDPEESHHKSPMAKSRKRRAEQMSDYRPEMLKPSQNVYISIFGSSSSPTSSQWVSDGSRRGHYQGGFPSGSGSGRNDREGRRDD